MKQETLNLINTSEREIKKYLEEVDDVVFFNSMKVLNAFKKNNLSEIHFSSTTGYGYNDIGRDVIERQEK